MSQKEDENDKRSVVEPELIQHSPSSFTPRKGSVFMMTEMNTTRMRKMTLREQVQEQMRKPSVKPKGRAGSVANFEGGNGTLRKLNTMIDLAFTSMHAEEEPMDEEELKELREKQDQDENYYWTLKQDPAYSKYLEKCKRKAKEEFDDFFLDTEGELETLEKKLGVDEESLKRIKEDFDKRRKQMDKKEKIKTEAEKNI